MTPEETRQWLAEWDALDGDAAIESLHFASERTRRLRGAEPCSTCSDGFPPEAPQCGFCAEHPTGGGV